MVKISFATYSSFWDLQGT